MHGLSRIASNLNAIARAIAGISVAPLASDGGGRRPMDPTSLTTNDRFDRLQELLLRLNVGEHLRPDEAARESGLPEETCRAVLVGLERVGLMTLGENDRFVRCRLNR